MRTEKVAFRSPFQYRRTCGPRVFTSRFIRRLVFFFLHACTQFSYARPLTTRLAVAPSRTICFASSGIGPLTAAVLASSSAVSLPSIPTWAGSQRQVAEVHLDWSLLRCCPKEGTPAERSIRPGETSRSSQTGGILCFFAFNRACCHQDTTTTCK
jgi:hypothetical protein